MPQSNAHTEGASPGWVRIGGAVLGLAAVLSAAVLGWRWHRSIPVRRVVVEGAAHAAPDSLRALARPDTARALYRLQPRRVADRLRRHPWVRRADVSRRPDGTLRLAVTERTPAALVFQDGAAAYYLDAAGYPLPLASERAGGRAAFDVPLVRGLAEAYHPLHPTDHAALRQLLTALARDSTAAALVSEIRTGGAGGALRLRTVPPGGRGQSAVVRLGAGGAGNSYPRKLRTLAAFWQQAMRKHPGTAFHEVDLRFDGQIVAREAPLARGNTEAR